MAGGLFLIQRSVCIRWLCPEVIQNGISELRPQNCGAASQVLLTYTYLYGKYDISMYNLLEVK